MDAPRFETKVDKEPTLEYLQEYVGGYIEVQYLPQGEMIIINEDGRRLELPFNSKASAYAGFQILGNAILLKDKAVLT